MRVRSVRRSSLAPGLCVLLAPFFAETGLAAEPARPAPAPLPPAAARPVDFARDVFPLLQKRCVACHGPDAQEGRLRLDARQIVAKGGKAGPLYPAGRSAESLLIARVAGSTSGPRMPLDEAPLTDAEIGLLRAWIDQGAAWPAGIGSDAKDVGPHWAYVAPQRPPVPDVANVDWPRNALDRFVLAELERRGESPSPPADRVQWLRRVTLDLTGLPPAPTEIDAFLADHAPGAEERTVDRLLASPRYGERWAVPWLDLARFADSNGYQRDGRREAWAYRDWVIAALNDDLPFDRFTVAQIAGDLLPGAGPAERIATGFHRNTMANVEAGTDPEEQRVLALVDRVNTTGTVWLGTTLECAQCHDHKYDPFTQRDYYRLYAFFNSTEKEIVTRGSEREFVGPKMEVPLTPESVARQERLRHDLAALDDELTGLAKRFADDLAAWQTARTAAASGSTWETLDPLEFAGEEGTDLQKQDDRSLLALGDGPSSETYRIVAKTRLERLGAFALEALTDPSLPNAGPGRAAPGDFRLSEFKVEAAPADDPTAFRPIPLVAARADFSAKQFPVTGAIDGQTSTSWAIGPRTGRSHRAVFAPKDAVPFPGGAVLRFSLVQRDPEENRALGRFQLAVAPTDPGKSDLPQTLRAALAVAPAKRTDAQHRLVLTAFAADAPRHEGAREVERIERARTALQETIAKIEPPSTLVMREMDAPRDTFVFARGDFLKPGQPVGPGLPEVLSIPEQVERSDAGKDAPPASPGTRASRVDLAEWLVSPTNPLVARVTVNRQWAEFFGRGLVASVEDFGTHGERPTHPALLDWLAVEFVENGWSLKRLHRTIVLSATYRQSSDTTPEALRRDPQNLRLGRMPRLRLPAEFVRDNALAVAGLLVDRPFGPPVFPVQPPGVWNHTGRASNTWETSAGTDLHRRGLYTYWRRTVPYPSFVNFDAPSREACTVKRSRSNTPLQALTLLNDPVFFEAATGLAARILKEPAAGTPPEARVDHAFRLAVARRPTDAERAILVARYAQERDRFRREPAALKALLARWPAPAGLDPLEYAAWTHVANVLLNLDETVTRG